MRAIASSTRSRGDISRRRTSVARPHASYWPYSANATSDLHVRVAMSPRSGLLELARELEQRFFVAERRRELHPDRQSFAVPPERQVHRRLPGHVLEGGER